MSLEVRTATATSADEGTPLHRFVRAHFKTVAGTRSQCHAAFKAGRVRVNETVVAEGHRMVEGETVSLATDSQHSSSHSPSLARTLAGVHLVCGETWIGAGFAVVRKDAGVSMDVRSSAFVDAVKVRLGNVRDEVRVLPVLDKAVSGLVVAFRNQPILALSLESIECTYRCIVIGKVGAEEGLEAGDEFARDLDVRGSPCSTRFRIVSYTHTRNAPDGFITTLDATPVAGFKEKQVLSHLYYSDFPVIGNSRLTKQHRTCRDKGIFLSLILVAFNHPTKGVLETFSIPEPTKFEALRLKEAKFFDRKMDELEQAVKDKQIGDNDDADQEADDERTSSSATPVATQHFKNAAYIRGTQSFRNLTFKVSPAVMIPRPSSSILVDEALTAYLCSHPTATACTVLDLGTGSGSLLIATLHALPAHTARKGIALDVSVEALSVAQENLEAHAFASLARTHHGTFSALREALEEEVLVHIVLCNPPYLSPRIRRVTSIDASLLREEPVQALFANGETGLEAYAEVAKGLNAVRKDVFAIGCVFVVEIGHGMASRVRKVLEDGFEGCGWEFLKMGRDIRMLERCLVYQMK
ncbi:S-adenosyl-L-methionine-dependent methyltransferase [Chytriomyces sp. MP71]|nr:S-adenosyl-L-methionine-dependent methyltransferase [Chytriomyces sp. MP71]